MDKEIYKQLKSMKGSVIWVLYEALLYAWEKEIVETEMIPLCGQTKEEFIEDKLEEWIDSALSRDKNPT